MPCHPVVFKKTSFWPVDFKKVPCHPIDFKKTSCRPVDFKKLPPCRMSLKPKKGHVAVLILVVYTPDVGIWGLGHHQHLWEGYLRRDSFPRMSAIYIMVKEVWSWGEKKLDLLRPPVYPLERGRRTDLKVVKEEW